MSSFHRIEAIFNSLLQRTSSEATPLLGTSLVATLLDCDLIEFPGICATHNCTEAEAVADGHTHPFLLYAPTWSGADLFLVCPKTEESEEATVSYFVIKDKDALADALEAMFPLDPSDDFTPPVLERQRALGASPEDCRVPVAGAAAASASASLAVPLSLGEAVPFGADPPSLGAAVPFGAEMPPVDMGPIDCKNIVDLPEVVEMMLRSGDITEDPRALCATYNQRQAEELLGTKDMVLIHNPKWRGSDLHLITRSPDGNPHHTRYFVIVDEPYVRHRIHENQFPEWTEECRKAMVDHTRFLTDRLSRDDIMFLEMRQHSRPVDCVVCRKEDATQSYINLCDRCSKVFWKKVPETYEPFIPTELYRGRICGDRTGGLLVPDGHRPKVTLPPKEDRESSLAEVFMRSLPEGWTVIHHEDDCRIADMTRVYTRRGRGRREPVYEVTHLFHYQDPLGRRWSINFSYQDWYLKTVDWVDGLNWSLLKDGEPLPFEALCDLLRNSKRLHDDS